MVPAKAPLSSSGAGQCPRDRRMLRGPSCANSGCRCLADAMKELSTGLQMEKQEDHDVNTAGVESLIYKEIKNAQSALPT